jgi:hypothetical protein
MQSDCILSKQRKHACENAANRIISSNIFAANRFSRSNTDLTERTDDIVVTAVTIKQSKCDETGVTM